VDLTEFSSPLAAEVRLLNLHGSKKDDNFKVLINCQTLNPDDKILKTISVERGLTIRQLAKSE